MKPALAFAVLFLCQLTNSSAAQLQDDSKNPPYPGEANITFQWSYTCASGRACSFNCPGAGSASEVTALDVYLGSVPVGRDQHTAALFYNFSTRYLPRGNGFSISAGFAALSCQVNGMNLNYSGPPRQ
jgi:hypothetical protein